MYLLFTGTTHGSGPDTGMDSSRTRRSARNVQQYEHVVARLTLTLNGNGEAETRSQYRTLWRAPPPCAGARANGGTARFQRRHGSQKMSSLSFVIHSNGFARSSWAGVWRERYYHPATPRRALLGGHLGYCAKLRVPIRKGCNEQALVVVELIEGGQLTRPASRHSPSTGPTKGRRTARASWPPNPSTSLALKHQANGFCSTCFGWV